MDKNRRFDDTAEEMFGNQGARTAVPFGEGDAAECVEAAPEPLPDDPWIHRSTQMSCRTCMAFVAKATMRLPDERGVLGRCRKHAPTMGGFPAVFEKDWCMDHKIDEDKI